MDTKMLTMPLPEKTTTKGIERIVSLKGLKLPSSLLLAKRPRNGMFLYRKHQEEKGESICLR